MITLSEAKEHIIDSLQPLPFETVDLVEAVGRAVATNSVASEAVPPFNNSSVDGYAVRSDDVKPWVSHFDLPPDPDIRSGWRPNHLQPHHPGRTLRNRLATGGTMKLSARNQLNGTVEAVDHGAVTTTIKIRLQGGDLIPSSITKEAADDLQLKAGSAVIAVIKSSDVIVAVA